MPYADPERRKEYNKQYNSPEYRQKNKQRLYKNTLRWRKKNWEKHLAAAARYRENHPDRVKETNHASEDKRRGTRNDYKKQWITNNREKHLASMARTRLKRKLAKEQNGGNCTVEQWRARCEIYGWLCAYCSMQLNEETVEIDHVIPVADGGSGWPANLVPACRSCNASKWRHRRLPRRLLEFSEMSGGKVVES